MMRPAPRTGTLTPTRLPTLHSPGIPCGCKLLVAWQALWYVCLKKDRNAFLVSSGRKSPVSSVWRRPTKRERAGVARRVCSTCKAEPKLLCVVFRDNQQNAFRRWISSKMMIVDRFPYKRYAMISVFESSSVDERKRIRCIVMYVLYHRFLKPLRFEDRTQVVLV